MQYIKFRNIIYIFELLPPFVTIIGFKMVTGECAISKGELYKHLMIIQVAFRFINQRFCLTCIILFFIKDSVPEKEKFIYTPTKTKTETAKGNECNETDEKKHQYKSNLFYAIEANIDNTEHQKELKDDKDDHTAELEKFIPPDQGQYKKIDDDVKDVEHGFAEKRKKYWKKYLSVLKLPQHWFFFFGVIGTTLAAIFNAINLVSLICKLEY